MYKLTYDDKKYSVATCKALSEYLDSEGTFSIVDKWINFKFNYDSLKKDKVECLLNEIKTSKIPYTIILNEDMFEFSLLISDLSYFGNRLVLNAYISKLEEYMYE